ncbi:MAG: hypothetical protein EXQ88_03605 [Alphaproteobacteria bacterium]|nr:hypothetical protein [Alphaproteobacteria bacterium]
MQRLGKILFALVLAAWIGGGDGARAQDCAKVVRFESLRAGEVYFRAGPGADYPIDWIFKKKSLPVAVIGEFELWRRVCDFEGTVGWVHRSMLSNASTAMIIAPVATLRRAPVASSPAVARAEASLVGEVQGCEQGWCRMDIQGFKGWVERKSIWGAVK